MTDSKPVQRYPITDYLVEEFQALRTELEISDTAAAILVLADTLREVGHDERGNQLAQCVKDLVSQ